MTNSTSGSRNLLAQPIGAGNASKDPSSSLHQPLRLVCVLSCVAQVPPGRGIQRRRRHIQREFLYLGQSRCVRDGHTRNKRSVFLTPKETEAGGQPKASTGGGDRSAATVGCLCDIGMNGALEFLGKDPSTKTLCKCICDHLGQQLVPRSTAVSCWYHAHLCRYSPPSLLPTLLFQYTFVLLFHVYRCFSCICNCVLHMCISPQRPEKGIRSCRKHSQLTLWRSGSRMST